MTKVKRLTVSLPYELADWLHKQAELLDLPVSAVVAQSLWRAWREERNRRIAIELWQDAQESEADTTWRT